MGLRCWVPGHPGRAIARSPLFVVSRSALDCVLAGDLLVVLGFYIVFKVFCVNTFTSATIEVNEQQTVISINPYAFVLMVAVIVILPLLAIWNTPRKKASMTPGPWNELRASHFVETN